MSPSATPNSNRFTYGQSLEKAASSQLTQSVQPWRRNWSYRTLSKPSPSPFPLSDKEINPSSNLWRQELESWRYPEKNRFILGKPHPRCTWREILHDCRYSEAD
jgi:hypothetical protein